MMGQVPQRRGSFISEVGGKVMHAWGLSYCFLFFFLFFLKGLSWSADLGSVEMVTEVRVERLWNLGRAEWSRRTIARVPGTGSSMQKT